MRQLILCGVPAAATATLSDLDDITVSATTAAELHAPPHTPTVVILGPAVADPAEAIRRLRPSDSAVRVVLLADPAADDPVRLMTGRNVVLLHPGATAELPQLVARLLREAERQHRYRLSSQAAQSQLEAAASTELTRQLGHRLFGDMLTHAPIGAVLLDIHTGILAWNDRAGELLCLTEPHSIGVRLPDLFDGHDRHGLGVYLRAAATSPGGTQAAGTATPRTPRFFNRCGPDSSIQHLRLTTQPVSGASGEQHCLVVIDDVTETVVAQRQLQQRNRQAILTAEIAAAMTATGPLAQRLTRCAEATVTHLDAAFTRIWLLPPRGNTLELHASAGLYTHLDGQHARIPVGQFKIGRIAANRRPHLTNNVLGDPQVHDQQWARREGMIAFAGYPLISGGELVGVLGLFARHTLPATTTAALGGIADQIAIGIRQDRLLRQLTTIAEALQRPLLPPTLPVIPGIDLAGRYHAHTDGTEVGGDFYDAFALPDGRYAITLSDVCGKGPEAAAVTGLVRHTLWTAAQHQPDPQDALVLLNKALLRAGHRFCTLIYAVLTPPSANQPAAQLTLASCGHPPPLLISAGTITTTTAAGILLGVTPHLRITTQQLSLQPTDTLVAYTDGFTEGANRHSTDDAQQLVTRALTPNGAAHLTADAIADQLTADTLHRAANHLNDDLALLVLQIRTNTYP